MRGYGRSENYFPFKTENFASDSFEINGANIFQWRVFT